MKIAVPRAPFAAARARWAWHGGALALVAIAILCVFRRDVGDMIDVWWTNTTFGHCLFIGPVVAWLVWTRRGELAQLTPVAWWPGLAIVAGGGAGWLLGEAAGVHFARQLGVVMLLQGAVVTLLGPMVARGLAFPLAYAVFLVPFGESLEPPLQGVTVMLVMPMLHALGIPAVVDGVLIHADRYWFEVAEACSGAKFVIAMAAFGILVANVCFVSWPRRIAFLAFALVVPVLANGVRAAATIWYAVRTSVERATGVDHIVFGWVFFAVVMALVMAAGWRWFDRAPDDAAFDPAALQAVPRHALALMPAVALVLATVAVFPLWSAAIAARAQALPERIVLPEVPGWHRVPLSMTAPWTPHYPGADHRLIGRYADAQGHMVDLAIAAYAGQSEGRELVGFGIGVLRENDRWVRIRDEAALRGGSVLRMVAPGPVERVVATWYRVGMTTTNDPRAVKVETARARLLGGPQRAVAIHLSAQGPGARAAIDRLAAAIGPVGALADRLTGTR